MLYTASKSVGPVFAKSSLLYSHTANTRQVISIFLAGRVFPSVCNQEICLPTSSLISDFLSSEWALPLDYHSL